MYTLVGGIVLAFIAIIVLRAMKRGIWLATIAAAIIMFFAILVGAITGSIDGTLQKEVVSKSPLLSLKTESKAEGQFFLASGNVDQHDVYRYYLGSEESGYYPQTLEASNDVKVIIFEDTSVNPYLEVAKNKIVPNTLWGLGGEVDRTIYEFHVPKGSVLRGYSFQ